MDNESERPAGDEDGPAIQAADPGSRRLLIILVVIAAAVGVAGHFALQHWLAQQLEAGPADARTALMRAIWIGAWIAALLIAVLGAWCWRQGGSIRRAARFPLPAARLLRDTRIVTGPAACRRGRWLQVAAGGLLLLAAGFMLAIAMLTARLEAAP